MSKYLNALSLNTQVARKSFAKGRGIEAWRRYFYALSAIQDVMLFDKEISSVQFQAFVKLCNKKIKEFDMYYL